MLRLLHGELLGLLGLGVLLVQLCGLLEGFVPGWGLLVEVERRVAVVESAHVHLVAVEHDLVQASGIADAALPGKQSGLGDVIVGDFDGQAQTQRGVEWIVPRAWRGRLRHVRRR